MTESVKTRDALRDCTRRVTRKSTPEDEMIDVICVMRVMRVMRVVRLMRAVQLADQVFSQQSVIAQV